MQVCRPAWRAPLPACRPAGFEFPALLCCREDNPEAFHHELENAAWEESMRGCAINTYLALFEAHREAVAPVVLGLLQAANEACAAALAAAAATASGAGAAAGAQPQPPAVHGIPAAVLAKAAVYQAAAVGSYELHEYIDFSSWLRASLLGEMADATPALRPLRRAAVKLVSHWLPKLRKEDRPAVYRTLLGVLAAEDAALQLAALVTLQAMVDDW